MLRLLITLLLLPFCSLLADAGESHPGVTHQQALANLIQGNQRFVSDQPQMWSASAAKRTALTAGQHPLACVITCSDSRVPPEVLFDQSLGDLFVVRLAGNVVTPEAVGSVEYAVEHLHVPLVVVLGHSQCGAVGAALSPPSERSAVHTVLDCIDPAVLAARSQGYEGADLAAAVVRGHAQRGTIALLDGSRAVASEVQAGQLTIISAIYDLASGHVDWLTQLSAPPTLPPVAATPAPAPESHHAVTPAVPEPSEPASGASRYKVKSVESSTHVDRHRP